MTPAARALAVVIAAVVVVAVAGCPPSPPPLPLPPAAPAAVFPMAVKFGGEIFASNWTVTLIVRDAAAAARARGVEPLVQAALNEVGRQLSLWEPESELSRFNRTVWKKEVPVTPGLHALLATSLQVGKDTDGAFDITLGPLLDLWGFSAAQKGKVTAPPEAVDIARVRARTGLSLIHLGEGSLIKDRSDVVVDLTAIGDGAAAAAVMALLRERGFTDALIDIAGEVVVSGAGLAGPWRVGVNVPAEDAAPDAVERTVALVPAAGSVRALSTSGTYREAFSKDGTRYPHILDPRTAAPVTHNLVSCTIVADDVVVADALSTACIVLGVEGTRKVLPRFPGASALFLTAEAGAPTFAAATTEGFPATL